MNRSTFRHAALVALALGSAVLPAHAQNRPQAPGSGSAPLAIALTVGSSAFQFAGQGQCKSAPEASIHGVSASLHSVNHSAGNQSVNLSVWTPKAGGAPMMNLSFSEGRKRYEVDTVKAGTKQATKGSGTVSFRKKGDGGQFTIDAVAASGENIKGQIECGRIGGLVAAGG